MLVTKAKQEIGESFCWKPEDIFEKSIKKKKFKSAYKVLSACVSLSVFVDWM